MKLPLIILYPAFTLLSACAHNDPDPRPNSSPIDSTLGLAERFTYQVHAAVMVGDSLFLQRIPSRRLERLTDLNGDQHADSITVLFYNRFAQDADVSSQEAVNWINYVVRVNDSSILGEGENFAPIVQLVDIDQNDSFHEIALTDLGPSDDHNTQYILYSNRTLSLIGTVEGANFAYHIKSLNGAEVLYSPVNSANSPFDTNINISYPGNGTIIGRKRARILHTWWYPATYRLTDRHEIRFVPQLLYPMNTSVRLQRRLRLVQSPTDTGTAFILEPGDRAIILSSDDKRWCVLRGPNGQEGWFAVSEWGIIDGSGLHASDIFQGLSAAD